MNSIFLAAVIATMPLPEGKVNLYDDVATCEKGHFVELVDSKKNVVDMGCWWYSDDGAKIVVQWDSVEPQLYYDTKRVRFKTLSLMSASIVTAIIVSTEDHEERPVSP